MSSEQTTKQITLFEAARIALTVEEGDARQIAAQDAFFQMVEGELTDFQHEMLSSYCQGATVPEMVIEGLRLVFANRCGDEPEQQEVPLYLREFPDFTLNVPIPAGFVDTSWHNDACPSWENETLGLKLWINYEDRSKHEIEGSKFYTLTDSECLGLVNEQSDSWDKIVEAILIHRVAHAFTTMMTEGVPTPRLQALIDGYITFGDLNVDQNPVMEQALEQNGVKVFCDQGHMHEPVTRLWGLAYATAISFYLPMVGKWVEE